MSLLDTRAILSAIGQFVVLPGVVERLARRFFVSTHTGLSQADRLVLSQRFTRAFVALNLVQGAARSLLSATGPWNQHVSTAHGQYYLLGTIIFYVFDTALLAIQRAKTYDIWAHHILAIGSFSYFLLRGISEQAGMFILLNEFLVPWGFLLFYFKLNNLRANPAFLGVTLGGIGTLCGRIFIWCWLLWRMWTAEYDITPSTMWIIGNSLIGPSVGLDLYWLRLYATNLLVHRKAAAALKGAPPPSLFSAMKK